MPRVPKYIKYFYIDPRQDYSELRIDAEESGLYFITPTGYKIRTTEVYGKTSRKLLKFFICPLCGTQTRYLYPAPFINPDLYTLGKGTNPNKYKFACRKCAKLKYLSQK